MRLLLTPLRSAYAHLAVSPNHASKPLRTWRDYPAVFDVMSARRLSGSCITTNLGVHRALVVESDGRSCLFC